jgi:DNA-binding NarL/FixJ family response regulator
MIDAPLSILVVDDQVLFRQGLVGLLASRPEFTIAGEAGTVAEAVAQARTVSPDVILMDFSLPDGTGLDATRAILEFQPAIKIVFLTVDEADETLFAAVRAGAKGYLLKNTRVEKLLAYLRGLQRDEPAFEPRMTGRILEEFSRSRPTPSRGDALDQLSEREQQVLAAIVAGASNSEIAARLVISENTVKNHVRHILDKLGLASRREAARYVETRNT